MPLHRMLCLLLLVLCVADSSHAREKLSISFAGFYTSGSTPLEADRLHTLNTVALRGIHSEFKRQLDHRYDIAPFGYTKSLLNKQNSHIAQGLHWFMESTLQHTSEVLLASDQACRYCNNQFPFSPDGWQENDRIVMIAGLQIRATSGAPKSGLTAVVFDGNGKFIGIETAHDSIEFDNADSVLKTCLHLLYRLGLHS